MNEKELQELYNLILSRDSTYGNDVTYDMFKQKMSNSDYSKKIKSWLGYSPTQAAEADASKIVGTLTQPAQPAQPTPPVQQAKQIQKKPIQNVTPTAVGTSAAVGKELKPDQEIVERVLESYRPRKEEPEKDYFTGELLEAKKSIDRAIPLGIGEFIEDMARAVESGWRQGKVSANADIFLTNGANTTDDQILGFMNAKKKYEEVGTSDAMREYQKTYEREGSNFWGFVKGLSENPLILPEVVLSSMSQLVSNPDAVKGFFSVVLPSAAAGAGVGATGGGVGAIPGAIAGAGRAMPYAFGLASSISEMGATFSELLTEELGGREMTKESVREILEDPERLNRIRNKAIVRGVVIGVFDAYTGKLASGVSAKIIERSAAKSGVGAATRSATVKSVAASSLVEGGGGSFGEAAARASIGQDMDISEIALEGVAELPGGIRSTVQARLAKPEYKVNGVIASEEEVDRMIDTMTADQLSRVKVDIKNDFLGKKNKIQDKILSESIRNQVTQANPNMSSENIERVVGLEKELKKFEGNTTQSGKDRAAAIRSEIKNIQENAVQEQSTDAGVLRSEGPEMGLQQVGEGDQGAQVAATRTQEEVAPEVTPQVTPGVAPEVTPQVTEGAKDLGISIDDESIDARITDEKQKGIVSLARTAVNSIKSIMPNIEFIVHDSQDSYTAAVAPRKGMASSGGNFSIETMEDGTKKYRIDINLTKANNRVIAHEITHAVLHDKFNNSVEAFTDFNNRLSKVVSSMTPQMFINNKGEATTVKQALEIFVNRYTDKSVRPEEYLAELSAMLANNEAKISLTGWQKIAAMINEFVSNVTGGKLKVFEDIKNTKDVVDFFKSVSSAIAKGEDVAGFDIRNARNIAAREAVTQQGVTSKSQILSEYRDNKRFKLSELKYPDVVFGSSSGPTDMKTAANFYKKIVAAFNKIFDRDVKVISETSNNDFGVIVEYETGLRPKYFSYPTAKMGEHVIVDKIDKNTPLTSLRHELIHEMLVKNITDKFERINEMDKSAESKSIEEVQRNRAYNYTLEDVFFERVVENIERLPDNKDTFPIETYAEDVINRITSDLNTETPTKDQVNKKLSELLEGSNSWLSKNITDAINKADFSKPLLESKELVGKYFSDRFNLSKDIFPKELQSKIFKFTEIFNNEYQGVLTRLKKGKENEIQQGRDRGDQDGGYTPLEGSPVVAGATGPIKELVDAARRYAEKYGIPYRRQGEYVKIDEAFSKKLADAYEEMKHDPTNPMVKEAYADLIKQTKQQYDALVEAGYSFTFFDSNTDPYEGNPYNAMRDLRNNKKMAVYGTYDGYGTDGITGAAVEDNPMLENTGIKWPDQNGVDRDVTANDLFRAVHDAFGHGLEGTGFRARGEENAWQAHVRLFTGPAVAAITTETRGQNSWLNYGPFGEKNRTAKLEDTVFAEQKTGLMPEWTWTENIARDENKPNVVSKASMLGEERNLDTSREQNKGIEISELKKQINNGLGVDMEISPSEVVELNKLEFSVLPKDDIDKSDISKPIILIRKRGAPSISITEALADANEEGLGGKPISDLSDYYEIVDGRHRIKKAISEGKGLRSVVITEAEYENATGTKLYSKETQSILDDIGVRTIKEGIAFLKEQVRKNRSDSKSISELETLIEEGYFIESSDKSEASNVVSKSSRLAPEDEASEQTLPGYDNLMAGVKSFVDKAKGRGDAKSDIVKNAADIVQSSPVYENASDMQREQMVRDARKLAGASQKSAPSVKKLFGIKPKDITISELEALNNQIKFEARAAREAKNDLNGKRKQLAEAVRRLAKSGNVSAKKVAAIINKIGSLNLYSQKAVSNFIQYATNVFADADYAQKLSDAKSTRSKIKKLSKNKDKLANLRDLASRFAEIDPSMVEDIDEYNKIASLVKESVKGSTTRGAELKLAEIVNDDTVTEYINDAIDNQNNQLLEEKIAEVQDLLGFDGTGMSYDELSELLASTEPVSKYNEGLIRAAVIKAFDTYKSIAESMISTGVDPISGDPVDYTENQKRVISEFIGMDIAKLNPKEAIEAIDALANFIQNKSTAKMESVTAKYNGRVNMERAEKKGIKGKPISKYWSKAFGRLLIEQTANLNILFERVFGGFNVGGFMEKMLGVTDIKNGASKAKSESDSIVKSYVDVFFNLKPNGESFNTAKNNIERGMVAFLGRNIIGTKAEMKAEFNRRVELVKQSIDELSKGNESELEKSRIYQEVFDKIVDGSKSSDDVVSKADRVNVDAVDFWRNKWSERYERLHDVAMGVYNKVLDKDYNYIPDRFSKLSFDTGEFEMSSDDMAFIFNTGNSSIYKKETGVLMSATRPDGLPVNQKTGQANRFVDLSFDSNNANAMYDALVDINTAAAIRQTDAAINSSSFRRIISSPEDRGLMQRRVKLYVNNLRKKNPFSDDEFSKFAKSLNRLATIGVGQALGGVFQPIKQMVPIAINTMINAGGLDVSSMSDRAKQAFISNSGYAIANRGVESQAQIDTLDKMISELSTSKADKVIDSVEKINRWWLKNMLVKFDVAIARASWITYYEQNLKKQGIDVRSIDYNTHQINEEAADYAQRQVDRQQNVSDADLSGAILSSKDSGKQLFTKIVMPFASFRMNQSARLGSDLSTLTSSTSTLEDKKVAARSLAGFMAEMATFRALSYGSALVIANVVSGMMGKDDDDEEEKKKKDAIMKGQLTNTVADMFSPAPILDRVVQIGVSNVLESVQNSMDIEEGDKVSIYTGDKQTFFQSLGLLGITGDRAVQLWEAVQLSNSGEFKDNYGNNKKVSDEDMRSLKTIIPLATLSAIGLAPTEVNSIVRSSIRIAKKDAESIKEEQQQPAGKVKKGRKADTDKERRRRLLLMRRRSK
jgi:hypothetical protein